MDFSSGRKSAYSTGVCVCVFKEDTSQRDRQKTVEQTCFPFSWLYLTSFPFFFFAVVLVPSSSEHIAVR